MERAEPHQAVETVDYLIIGAGLAGITLHHFLQSNSVAILDPHPGRFKLGESLIPEHFADPALAPLLEEVARLPSRSPKCGSLYMGDDSVAAFPLPPSNYPFAMHLRREELETRMAELWKTPILRERVTRLDVTTRTVETDTRTWRVRRQILDCSGPARVLARSMGDDTELWPSFSSWMYLDITGVHDERFGDFLRDRGLSYARFDPGVGRRLPQTEYEGWSPSNCTIVRRVAEGMFAWQIPLYDKAVLSFGVTSRHGPVSRSDLDVIAARSVAPCYDTVARPFDGSSQYNRFHVYNHFSRGATQVASTDWILVGDAAFFGEPIYATGTAVAVNQALYLARTLSNGPWGEEQAAEYTARWKRLVATSIDARKYFFAPPYERAASPPLFEDRGLNGTPFQLTMANNYGLILSGVKGWLAEDQSFGFHAGVTVERHQQYVARVRSLLPPHDSSPDWTVRSACGINSGLQVLFAHTTAPDLIVRVERRVAGRKYFREIGELGVAYRSLPDRPYPWSPDVLGLLDRICTSVRSAPSAWSVMTDEPAGN